MGSLLQNRLQQETQCVVMWVVAQNKHSRHVSFPKQFFNTHPISWLQKMSKKQKIMAFKKCHGKCFPFFRLLHYPSPYQNDKDNDQNDSDDSDQDDNAQESKSTTNQLI